ncbi:HxsD-like protein [Porcincola intestinalis]|uniref:HxsD-like protein n=1 Tax=Porcincola intestinalis TaxID=2606632 RepID=UPI003FA79BED
MIMMLNKEIFSKDQILYAINIYSNLADITINENNKYWLLKFQNCIYEGIKTEHEFENYLIGLEN